ncbi:hypothetical protein DHEL01_v202225 [Diaporthe helianthi]|uniref:Uncharacterized protein n=1 Tax=Diaporthe helianthi TaxID=158607 RepID=A0A2P5IA49_DIAHE|nr:hypothetical protein DHEL01_v202225 [Diaporthe helianthi]
MYNPARVLCISLFHGNIGQGARSKQVIAWKESAGDCGRNEESVPPVCHLQVVMDRDALYRSNRTLALKPAERLTIKPPRWAGGLPAVVIGASGMAHFPPALHLPRDGCILARLD